MRRYGNDMRILPTNNTVYIHRYSDVLSKHMPDDALKTYDETLLYSNWQIMLTDVLVILTTAEMVIIQTIEQINFMINQAKKRHAEYGVRKKSPCEGSEVGLGQGQGQVQGLGGFFSGGIFSQNHRVPLRFLTDLGLVNFPISLDTRYVCTLVGDLNSLFELKKKQSQKLTQK